MDIWLLVKDSITKISKLKGLHFSAIRCCWNICQSSPWSQVNAADKQFKRTIHCGKFPLVFAHFMKFVIVLQIFIQTMFLQTIFCIGFRSCFSQRLCLRSWWLGVSLYDSAVLQALVQWAGCSAVLLATTSLRRGGLLAITSFRRGVPAGPARSACSSTWGGKFGQWGTKYFSYLDKWISKYQNIH